MEARADPADVRRRSPRLAALKTVLIAAAVVAGIAALVTVGVRRYLSGAKHAEAKNAIGAIARSVDAHLLPDGSLCPSARPGDVAAWRCLGAVSLVQPSYCQYGYTSGIGAEGTPVWTKLGGPSLTGPSFEVVAECPREGEPPKIFVRAGRMSATGGVVLTTAMVESDD